MAPTGSRRSRPFVCSTPGDPAARGSPGSSSREVKIPASVIPDGSTAAVVNLTVDRAAAAGYLTAFPCGQPAPPSSNLNFVAGEARAVAAIVGLGLGSTMCVMSDIAADVIVDVNGYYAPAPSSGRPPICSR